MIHHTRLFNNIAAPDFVPYLIEASKGAAYTRNPNIARWNWHICWLNNDNQPIVGLLPRVSWTVLPSTLEYSELNRSDTSINATIDLPINVIKMRRQPTLPSYDKTGSSKEATECIPVSYSKWIRTLIHYSKDQLTESLNNAHTLEQRGTENNLEQSSYHHGLIGFIGYDIGAKALSSNTNIELANQPSAYFGHYDIYLKPSDDGWYLHTQADTDHDITTMVRDFLRDIDTQLQSLASTTSVLSNPPIRLKNRWQPQHYQLAFEKVQHYLYAGDSYQINLTHPWQGTLSTSTKLVNYLPALYQNTKAPFAGYLCVNNYNTTDSDSFELLSCSPELFVTFNKGYKDGINIITKPIKGTRPRGMTQGADEQLKNELANSDKDRAENVMIVDLLRNDLGKYAKVGSVQVPKLFAIETFINVHHMVSTVTATIKDDIHPLTVLFDSLPAGSITGTPKKRAVEIISELEVAARGAYCGTMGYMNFDGTGQWNVLIRTLQVSDKHISLWAGGGITVGSECDAEYQECFDKVGNLLKVLQGDS